MRVSLSSWSEQVDRDESLRRIAVPFLLTLFEFTGFFTVFAHVSWRVSAAIGAGVGLAASWTVLRKGWTAGAAVILVAQLLVLFLFEIARR